MSREFIITAPLLVNGKKAGEIVQASELTDEAHLVQIGWIVPNTKKQRERVDAVVESTSVPALAGTDSTTLAETA